MKNKIFLIEIVRTLLAVSYVVCESAIKKSGDCYEICKENEKKEGKS